MFKELKADISAKMDKVISAFQADLKSVRTGRASASLLDNVSVEAYGNYMPLNQVGSVSAQDSQLLVVQVWDRGMVKNVEKAINASQLGVTASADGGLVRIPIPPLSEERRKEMVKLLSKYAEQSRVALRNVRRECLDEIKTKEKNADMSKDDAHRAGEEIQKLTDEYTKKIDILLAEREKDIMKI